MYSENNIISLATHSEHQGTNIWAFKTRITDNSSVLRDCLFQLPISGVKWRQPKCQRQSNKDDGIEEDLEDSSEGFAVARASPVTRQSNWIRRHRDPFSPAALPWQFWKTMFLAAGRYEPIPVSLSKTPRNPIKKLLARPLRLIMPPTGVMLRTFVVLVACRDLLLRPRM